jgi:hypothetical protein
MVAIHPTLSFSSEKDEIIVINRTGMKIEFEIVELDKSKDILIVKK